MKKLIRGIVEFHRTRRDAVKDTFAELALGQTPDAFLIACSDSRVAVNVFASTDPGDVFVVRNPGNLVAPYEPSAESVHDESEMAALEFSLEVLKVGHIIVCGHSDCGAVKALCESLENQTLPALRAWLRHGEAACRIVREKGLKVETPAERDEVSRQNTLLQMEHLKTHPKVAQLLREKRLMLHGLWFDIHNAEVYYARPEEGVFRILDDSEGERILGMLSD